MKNVLFIIYSIPSILTFGQEDFATVEMEMNQFDVSFQAEVLTTYRVTKKGKISDVIPIVILCSDCNDKMRTEIKNIELQNWNRHSFSKKNAKLWKDSTFTQKTIYIINKEKN